MKLIKWLGYFAFIAVVPALPLSQSVHATHLNINGCGDDSGLGRFVPNQPSGVSFEPVCNNHDRCYGQLGRSRGDCDNRFRSELRAKCEKDLLRNGGGLVGTVLTGGKALTSCYAMAELYYQAVRERGGTAYQIAQDHAREDQNSRDSNRGSGARIALRTTSKGLYLVAENGGNGIINANRASVGPWEIFRLIDLNGGTLNSGDSINLISDQGAFVVAENGGGNALNANRSSAGPWEKISIIKLNGTGVINNGDTVALRSSTGHYVVAEDGGGGRVNANRTSVGPWEQFIIEFR